MSTTVNESFVSSRRSSLASILSISSSTASSSRRGSVTSVTSLDLTADELAFQECIEVIDANVEEVITNKAREKKWWVDGNYKIIDENRLPLILIEGDPQDAVDSSGSTTIHATPGRITRGSSKQPDDSFVPTLLPKPAPNPCDLLLNYIIENTKTNLNHLNL
ncbi:unnamed protein product [Rhizophagus irregularis]|uniref:Uncharacterized protein n=1 Tax=Rhizophagus irregularis TaxID=588596 RepID=A0A915YNK5_9GLOM|nr:unnamed protein product [Rhizophagus irregularis]CAB5296121.1 unnamed protein product [Rhizophagus irregularis]